MYDYQLIRKNKLRIPHDVYMQVRYKIEGYERLKQERDEVYAASPAPPDGLPKGSQLGNPTEHKAMLLANIDREISVIESCIADIKRDYGDRVVPDLDPIRAYRNYEYFNCAHIRSAYMRDEGPKRRVWHYYKSMLTYLIAHRLYLL